MYILPKVIAAIRLIRSRLRSWPQLPAVRSTYNVVKQCRRTKNRKRIGTFRQCARIRLAGNYIENVFIRLHIHIPTETQNGENNASCGVGRLKTERRVRANEQIAVCSVLPN